MIWEDRRGSLEATGAPSLGTTAQGHPDEPILLRPRIARFGRTGRVYTIMAPQDPIELDPAKGQEGHKACPSVAARQPYEAPVCLRLEIARTALQGAVGNDGFASGS